jgi:hypothetical protein
MTTDYLSANTFIERYQFAPFPGVTFNNYEVKEWIFELLRQIGPDTSSALIDNKVDVVNGKAKLPSGIQQLKTIVDADTMQPLRELFNSQQFGILTYKLYRGFIYTDFDNGAVVVTYIGNPIDEEGNPLVPNEQYYISAVDAYIRYKMAMKAYVQKKISLNEVEIFRTSADYYMITTRATNKELSPRKQHAFAKIRNRF